MDGLGKGRRKSRKDLCKQLGGLIAGLHPLSNSLSFSLSPSPLKSVKELPFTSANSASKLLKQLQIK